MLPKLVLSLVLGALFAFLVARGGMPLVPSAAAFARVQPWAVPAYLATLVAMTWFRASRWRFLVAPVKKLPMRDVILMNWIGFFAIFALPLRLGEFARPALGKIRSGIPLSTGFGTVAVERVVDGLVCSVCVAWALFALPRRSGVSVVADSLPFYGYLSLFVFASAFIALALFLWQQRLATTLTERTIGFFSRKLARSLSQKVLQVADGVRCLADPKLALPFLGETLIYWALNAFGMWVLAVGCGVPMNFSHAVAVMGILAIGVMLPAGPGMFGNFQLAVSAALQMFFASDVVESGGAVYVFLLYVVQAVFISVAGIVPLYVGNVRFADLLRAPPSEEPAA